jgi:ABC-type multidrug transport system fused ATPase/permease subunit
MTAAGASQSVFDYLDRKPVQRSSGTLQPSELRGEIEFNNVSLIYPARPNDIAVQVNSLDELRSITFLYIVEYDI